MPTFFDNTKLLQEKRALLNNSTEIFEEAFNIKTRLRQSICAKQTEAESTRSKESQQIESQYQTDINQSEALSEHVKAGVLDQLAAKKKDDLSHLQQTFEQHKQKQQITLKKFDHIIDALLRDWDTINRGATWGSWLSPFSQRLHRYNHINNMFDISSIQTFNQVNQLELDLASLEEKNNAFSEQKEQHQKTIAMLLKHPMLVEKAGLAFLILAGLVLVPIILHLMMVAVISLLFAAMTIVSLGMFGFILSYTMAQQGRDPGQELINQPYHAYCGNALLFSSGVCLATSATLLSVSSMIDSESAFDESKRPQYTSNVSC